MHALGVVFVVAVGRFDADHRHGAQLGVVAGVGGGRGWPAVAGRELFSAMGGSSLGSGTSSTAFNQPITGLTANTTYYFCAIVQSSEGTAFGNVLSFTTAAPATATTEAAIWVMLATCCRIGEISKAKWSDVDFDARRWKIPATNSKNKREHIVALSDFAMKWFQKLHASRLSNEWVLPAKNITPSGTETHVNEKSISKQVHDRQRTTPMKGRSKCVSVLLLSGGEWTPHDLRRSGATLMGELGVNDDVIERCLNHVEANRMKRTYQRQKAESAKMEAWRLLGERLEHDAVEPGNLHQIPISKFLHQGWNDLIAIGIPEPRGELVLRSGLLRNLRRGDFFFT